MPTRILADVYLRGAANGANRRVMTTPGRSVQFFGGHAQIVNHADMPHMLEMDNALVNPKPDAMPWAPEWLARVREIKAEVGWPEGWIVEFDNQSEYAVVPPATDTAMQPFYAHKTVSAPVETVDLTAHIPGGTIWIDPNDLLEDPDDDPEEPAPTPAPTPPVRKPRSRRR